MVPGGWKVNVIGGRGGTAGPFVTLPSRGNTGPLHGQCSRSATGSTVQARWGHSAEKTRKPPFGAAGSVDVRVTTMGDGAPSGCPTTAPPTVCRTRYFGSATFMTTDPFTTAGKTLSPA